MKKIYHLATCSTSKGILKQLDNGKGFEMQDIKTEGITPEQLDWLKEKVGSYEALFSRRALKYREWGLDKQELTEADFRRLILEEYTFLKRPVFVIGDEVYAGSAPSVVETVKKKAR